MFGNLDKDYKPTQLYHIEQNGFKCELFAADEILRGDVYYYWILSITQKEVSLPVIPDGAFDLVFSPELENFAALFPPRKERFFIPLQGLATYVGICLKAEKVERMFSLSMDDLTALETGAEVVEVLQLQKMVQSIQGEFDTLRLSGIFDRFFIERQPEHLGLKLPSMMENLMEILEEGTIETISSHLGISERQFRRVTKDLLGLSPKQIQRILRLQSALREILHPDEPRQVDYYDDSHRIRELKSLTGMTPGEISRMAEKYNHLKRR